MNVTTETLGCKVNLYESEHIAHRIRSMGLDRDVCVINTCTVTREADRQSRQAIRRAIRDQHNSLIVVTGCYAEMQPEVCAEIPGVDLVVPGSRKLEIPDLLMEQDFTEPNQVVAPADSHVLPQELPVGFESRTRAFVQVQQGCDNACTFCIIHKARGRSQSILPTTINRQVESFARQGFSEVVFCGIDLGAYGMDFNGEGDSQINLSVLVGQLAQRHPELRIRLSSIDPAHIDDALIETIGEYANICPQIHLSLQSASPMILKRMKRRYSSDDVYQVVEQLRSALPDLVLSADVMAGFPTESESDFAQTLNAIRNLEIAYPHVFPYSERDGTPAARIPKQVPVPIRKARAARLREVGHEVRSTVCSRYIGRQVVTLAEGAYTPKSNLVRTRMANYLPVYVAGEQLDDSGWTNIQITGLFGDGLSGENVA